MRDFITILILAIALALSFTAAEAQDVTNWHVADQVTVSWDPVTTTADDQPITEGTLEYSIFYDNAAKANPIQLWRGADTSAVLTLPTTGRYLLGIKSILVSEGQDVAESELAWTDDPAIVADGKTFGLMFFKPPKRPTGLSKQ